MREQRPSRTAEVVALQRALDQRTPADRRVVDDPYARHFLGPAASAALVAFENSGKLGRALERFGGLTAYIQARHRYLDDRLLDALTRSNQPIEQVVILGAGYDMRAYRFAEPLGDRPIYEVDHPATAARKQRILAQLRRDGKLNGRGAIPVVVDFQTQDLEERLTACGFSPGRRTFYVWEGVSMYLQRTAVQATLRTLSHLGATGSELVMDCWFLIDQLDLRSMVNRLGANLLHLLGEPVLFGIHPEDVGPFLARLGWRLDETAGTAELEKRYIRDGRPLLPGNYVLWAKSDRELLAGSVPP